MLKLKKNKEENNALKYFTATSNESLSRVFSLSACLESSCLFDELNRRISIPIRFFKLVVKKSI